MPNRVRLFNTPTLNRNLAHVVGFFIQDSWSIGPRLTLNIGGRIDNYRGILPEQSNQNVAFDHFQVSALEADGTGPHIEPRAVSREEKLNHPRGVWRTGLVFDVAGDGRTAIKASYSRYALQVGIDRVTALRGLRHSREPFPVATEVIRGWTLSRPPVAP